MTLYLSLNRHSNHSGVNAIRSNPTDHRGSGPGYSQSWSIRRPQSTQPPRNNDRPVHKVDHIHSEAQHRYWTGYRWVLLFAIRTECLLWPRIIWWFGDQRVNKNFRKYVNLQYFTRLKKVIVFSYVELLLAPLLTIWLGCCFSNGSHVMRFNCQIESSQCLQLTVTTPSL